jgi:hypothetical protein
MSIVTDPQKADNPDSRDRMVNSCSLVVEKPLDSENNIRILTAQSGDCNKRNHCE